MIQRYNTCIHVMNSNRIQPMTDPWCCIYANIGGILMGSMDPMGNNTTIQQKNECVIFLHSCRWHRSIADVFIPSLPPCNVPETKHETTSLQGFQRYILRTMQNANLSRNSFT